MTLSKEFGMGGWSVYKNSENSSGRGLGRKVGRKIPEKSLKKNQIFVVKLPMKKFLGKMENP